MDSSKNIGSNSQLNQKMLDTIYRESLCERIARNRVSNLIEVSFLNLQFSNLQNSLECAYPFKDLLEKKMTPIKNRLVMEFSNWETGDLEKYICWQTNPVSQKMKEMAQQGMTKTQIMQHLDVQELELLKNFEALSLFNKKNEIDDKIRDQFNKFCQEIFEDFINYATY